MAIALSLKLKNPFPELTHKIKGAICLTQHANMALKASKAEIDNLTEQFKHTHGRLPTKVQLNLMLEQREIK